MNANTRVHQHVYNCQKDDNDDMRNRRNTSSNFLSLKEARKMIPEFDGTSRRQLQKFLNTITYIIKNIDPAEEESLVQAILYLKLKGTALRDFQTRDIHTFEELKQRLKMCYPASKESMAHLQIKFNSLKQKIGESAQTFGRRVDKLAMTLYESMTEDENYSVAEKRVIFQTVQKQALLNFQIGLHDNDLKMLVRSKKYATLQDAIINASGEENFLATRQHRDVSTRSKHYTSTRQYRHTRRT